MFATRFAKLLELNDETVYHVAQNTKISESLLGRYKSGKVRPSMKNLQILADYFRVSTDYFLGNTISAPGGVVLVQSQNTGEITVGQTKEVSVEQLELIRIYDVLDVKRRHKLMNTAFALEEEINA